jgi:murein DD-endopeptidase MepM/ murein hydrolase activator NlpD
MTRAPREFTEQPSKVTIHKIGERELEYDLFLDLNPDQCVIRDSNGDFFHIRPEDAPLLLNKPISDSLFDFNRVPIAGVPQGVWKLRKPDEEFHDTSIASVTAESNNIRIAQNRPFAINFNVEPDIVMLDVFDNKELIFTGPLEQLDIPNYDIRKDLQFVLTAEWRESEYNNYYGEAVYNLNVIYEVPANFSISDHQAEPGDLIIITAFNVGEKDLLTLTCEELEYKADFFMSGANKIGLLPVSAGFTGILNINIEGDYTDSFSVSVTPKSAAASKNVGAMDENITAHLSDNARQEKRVKYDEIIAKASSGQKLWEDNFVSPSPRENILYAFGTPITVNMGNTHTSGGANLEINSGDAVSASNAGRVIFTGKLPYDGNLIVIDHGGGLRTWYGRLDDIKVQEGDTVTAGQEIAKAGGSGIPTAPGLGLYFAASVNDIFIDPVILFGLNFDAGSSIPIDSDDADETGDLPEALE